MQGLTYVRPGGGCQGGPWAGWGVVGGPVWPVIGPVGREGGGEGGNGGRSGGSFRGVNNVLKEVPVAREGVTDGAKGT